VEPDGARKDAAVIDLVDLVNLGHRVTAHFGRPPSGCGNKQATP
jgi:hypothetical protein